MSWTRDQAHEYGKSIGLLESELEYIEKTLDRLPNRTELTVFGGMWSEHCSYKSTLPFLKTLPNKSDRVLAGPGSHAGVVDVGDGWGVAFKIESHNHPSAVEPYQGAATGVGGILRDIIAQGARPCAVMDSLCFGMPGQGRVDMLQKGVVAGVGGYGNAIGIPNVGGRVQYDRRYEGNPLVNALAAGLVRHDGMRSAEAKGIGNSILYVGATTGLDGILGAAFASEELSDDDNTESRSHVQVGDPFGGKKLMEACLSYTEDMGMLACQDMGACGISCAATEMAAAGKVGFALNLDTIPLREDGMTAHEILLSESQERFMFVIERGTEEAALAHFAKYGVHAAICGEVVEGEMVTATYQGEQVMALPAAMVADECPMSNWPVADALPEMPRYPAFEPRDLEQDLLELLATPGIADLTPVYTTYDQTVGNRTVRGPGDADAAVLKLPQSARGFALTITGRGITCASDPYLGAQAAIAEAMRNLACAGAEMVAITDGLNIGSPRDPVENKRLVETIRGLKDGLEAAGVPVTGGNVSLYNESPRGPIPPTPMVGGLGVIDDVGLATRNRALKGDVLLLLGELREDQTVSHFGQQRSGKFLGPGHLVDFEAEKALARVLLEMGRAGKLRGAKSTGAGGLGTALAKLCIRSNSGASVELTLPERKDWALFGEHPAQAWVAVSPEHADAVVVAAQAAGVPCQKAGVLEGERVKVSGCFDTALSHLRQAFSGDAAAA